MDINIKLPEAAWQRVLGSMSEAKINQMIDLFLEMTKQIQAQKAAQEAANSKKE